MTTMTTPTSLERPKTPPAVIGGAVAGSLALGLMANLAVASFNISLTLALSFLFGVVALYVITRKIEGARKALDRIVTIAMGAAFVVASLPLVSVVYTTVMRGTARFDTMFFTETMRNVVGSGGGIKQAIIGTLLITAAATVISVPIGVLVAIYLVEYGRGDRLAKGISWLVDVMTGIPSIVAGMFALGLFTTLFGPAYVGGIAGAVALSVLMIPVVVRSVEEMLRLVPDKLREASFGLGVPRWRTITKVVLPTAAPGIVTGVILAVARVVGETAPLLVTVGLSQSVNWNLFEGRMASIPLFIFQSYISPGIAIEAAYDRAWAAALVLMCIVAILFATARIAAHFLTPKGMR